MKSVPSHPHRSTSNRGTALHPKNKRRRRHNADVAERTSTTVLPTHHGDNVNGKDTNPEAALATPSEQRLLYLTEHLNEFTRSIDLSLAHKFNVLEHVSASTDDGDNADRATTPPSAAGCAVHPFDKAISSCRNEGQFQKLLVDSMAHLTTLHPSSSSRGSRRRSAPDLQSPPESEAPPVRITQVHNSVREFRLDCRMCASHRVKHVFGIHGTLGDVHVVTPPNYGEGHHHHHQRRHSNTTASSKTRRQASKRAVSQLPPPLLPPDTAVIVEVKHSTALNRTMLSQALLELELHKNLVCCQGRACLPEDRDLSPAAVLRKPLTNCACTEKACVVLVLWGAQSCAITSRCKSTGSRDLVREAGVFAWVQRVHGAMLQASETEGAAAARKLGAPHTHGVPHFVAMDPQNLLNVVRPLPHVRSEMRTYDGTLLGAVAWEVLSIHPSLDMTPFNQVQRAVERGAMQLRPTAVKNGGRDHAMHESPSPQKQQQQQGTPLQPSSSSIRRQRASTLSSNSSQATARPPPLSNKKRHYATAVLVPPKRAVCLGRSLGPFGWRRLHVPRRLLLWSIALGGTSALLVP